MNDKIVARLRAVERDHSVRILYACESGSRAWGFASRDSDYDVRFVYVHRKPWYLSVDLDRRRDVIEIPIDASLDINGWDLRKALRLLGKSNPSLLEWLRSPIVYFERPGFLDAIRNLGDACFSPRACIHHYLSMANNNLRDYLQGPEVSLKKYFYVLRPILAIRWIEAGNGPPPVEFAQMVDALVTDRDLISAIRDLETRKRSGAELDRGPRIQAISGFVESELQRLDEQKGKVDMARPPREKLNEFFRKTIEDAWTT